MRKRIGVLLVITMLLSACGTAPNNIEGQSSQQETHSSEDMSETITETEQHSEIESVAESEIGSQITSEASTEIESGTAPSELETEISSEQPSEEPAEPVYTYTDISKTMYAKSSVNVRDLPSTDGKKIGSLAYNQEVKVTGQCNETGWYRIEYKGAIGYVSSMYLSVEVIVKDEYEEKNMRIYSKKEVICYELPSQDSAILKIVPSFECLYVSAYNPYTGWYRIVTNTVSGGEILRTDVYYFYLEDYMTTEEYRALLNEGIDKKYYTLSCVRNAEDYCIMGEWGDRPFKMTGGIDEVAGTACVHINGKHNFVSIELSDACWLRKYNAEQEWYGMHTLYGIDNQDGTITVWPSYHGYESFTITEEEYYKDFSQYKVYDSRDDFSYQMDQYVYAEVLKVLNGE